MADITVTVSGPVGCGKSAIAGEIEIALRAVGVSVRFADEKGEREEKNMTGADWAGYIDMYKPTVVIAEQIDPARQTNLPVLEWRREGWVEAFAQPKGLGVWYSIQPEKPSRGAGDPPFQCYVLWGEPGYNGRDCLGSDFESVEAAKTVAEADFAKRIQSLLSPSPQSRAGGLDLTDDQRQQIMAVADRMQASPENVLKRAIGSYCAKYGGDGPIGEPDETNVVKFGEPE